jgi:small subunit ribosomal protein S16
MKKFGRRHRPFYRVCAIDTKQARDGRVLEELGSYDPMVPETDARAVLNHERIQYWLGVGARPSEKCGTLIKKYGPDGTHLDQQRDALDRLAQQRRRPEPPQVQVPSRADEEPTDNVGADAGDQTPAPETPEAESEPTSE